MTTRNSAKSFSDQQEDDRRKRRQIRNWIILIVVVVVAVVGINQLRKLGGTREITAVGLACSADQDVTVFGDSVLYYDNASIHCLSAGGGIKWSFPVGSGAHFSVSDSYIVIWVGSQLFIVDQNGKPTYNENMASPVQFARIGSRYCAVVIGSDTAPDLIIKRLDGTQEDEESEAYNGLILLDVGFYGDNDQYLWTLAMDVYGTAINSVLNTFQVGKMNTGKVSLGEFITYKVLFANNHLYAFTTQQMYMYDYKAVQIQSGTKLVYGWQLIDYHVPARGDALMLLAPTEQLNGTGQTVTDLRILTDSADRRYTLPSACVGAAVQGSSLYAVSSNYLYRTDVNTQRFYAYALPLPDNRQATGFVGLTSGGRAIVTSGMDVYSVSLPR